MGPSRCFEPPLVRPGQAIRRYSRAPLPICSRTGSTSTLDLESRQKFRIPGYLYGLAGLGACSSSTRRPSCSRSERPARRHSAWYVSPRASPETTTILLAVKLPRNRTRGACNVAGRHRHGLERSALLLWATSKNGAAGRRHRCFAGHGSGRATRNGRSKDLSGDNCIVRSAAIHFFHCAAERFCRLAEVTRHFRCGAPSSLSFRVLKRTTAPGTRLRALIRLRPVPVNT